MDNGYTLREKLSSIFLSYLLFFSSLSYFINLLIQDGLKIEFSVSAITYGIAVLVGIASYPLLLTKTPLTAFFIEIFLILGTMVAIVVYPESQFHIFTSYLDLAYNPTIILFAYCIPAMVICSSDQVKYDIVLKTARVFSRAIIIMFIICYFVFSVGTSVQGGQYMSTTYSAMPAICVCIVRFFNKEKHSYIDAALALIAVFITLIGGSRGALLCDVVFVLIMVLIAPDRKNNAKIFLVFLTIIIVSAVFVYFNKIILLLETYVSSRGMYSRTLSKIVSNSFYKSSDRMQLWDTVIKATCKSPIFGYGVWGDRPIIPGYTHNLFLELFCSYGFIFGGIIAVMLVVKIIKYVLSGRNIATPEYRMFLAAIPYGFFQLMFSDSYLYNVWFFAIVGILISDSVRSKENEGVLNIQ